MSLVAVAVTSIVIAATISKKERLAVSQRAAAELASGEAAYQRQDLVQARANLRAAFEVEDSAAARALWSKIQNNPVMISMNKVYRN